MAKKTSVKKIQETKAIADDIENDIDKRLKDNPDGLASGENKKIQNPNLNSAENPTGNQTQQDQTKQDSNQIHAQNQTQQDQTKQDSNQIHAQNQTQQDQTKQDSNQIHAQNQTQQDQTKQDSNQIHAQNQTQQDQTKQDSNQIHAQNQTQQDQTKQDSNQIHAQNQTQQDQTKQDSNQIHAQNQAQKQGQMGKQTSATDKKIRLPSEKLYELELLALIQNDSGNKPPNWLLSPRFVEYYVLGSSEEFTLTLNGQKKKIKITPKYFGNRDLVQKAIVTLASERGLMLIGEPGTGKSWLSEHLAAAICGNSTLLIQGTAGTTEDQIRYTWNYALLIAEGPSERALVKSPTINAMEQGKILRFEELTRCPQEIQDSMISIMSEKVIPIPELGREYLIFGSKGFNIIATANDRDKGVNEMSAALKRRFNFLYIPIVTDQQVEKKIVKSRVQSLMDNYNFKVNVDEEILNLLNTAFLELRNGESMEKQRFKEISSVMSTSEQISVLFDSALYANYFNNGKLDASHIALNICDTILKDDPENIPALNEYLNLVVKPRSDRDIIWKSFYDEFKHRLKLKQTARN